MNIKDFEIKPNQSIDNLIQTAMQAAYKTLKGEQGEPLEHSPRFIVDPEAELEEWPVYEAQGHFCDQCGQQYAAFEMPRTGGLSAVIKTEIGNICLHCLYSGNPELIGFNGIYAAAESADIATVSVINMSQSVYIQSLIHQINKSNGIIDHPGLKSSGNKTSQNIARQFHHNFYDESLPRDLSEVEKLFEGNIKPDYHKSKKADYLSDMMGCEFEDLNHYEDKLNRFYAGEKVFVLSPEVAYNIYKYSGIELFLQGE